MADGIIPIIDDNGVHNANWEKNLEDFPSVEQLQKNLEDLLSTDKSSMTPQEIRDIFYEKVVFFSNGTNYVLKDTFNTQSFWRARKNIGDSEDITTIQPFTYPKTCIVNGRANIKDCPVFYCSNTRAAPLFEIKPNVGDIIYLSRWDVACDSDVQMRFLFSEDLPKKNPFHDFAMRQIAEMTAMSKLYAKEKAVQLEMVTRFLGNAFIKEEFPYALTSWLAHDILFGKEAVDILCYSSVLTNHVSCNLAITPAFTDKYLIPRQIFKMEVLERTERNIRPVILEVGEIHSSKIIWRETQEADMDVLR